MVDFTGPASTRPTIPEEEQTSEHSNEVDLIGYKHDMRAQNRQSQQAQNTESTQINSLCSELLEWKIKMKKNYFL